MVPASSLACWISAPPKALVDTYALVICVLCVCPQIPSCCLVAIRQEWLAISKTGKRQPSAYFVHPCSASRAPARSGKYPQDALQLLRKLLGWPAPQLFPALDLARLAALDAGAAESLAGSAGAVSPDSEAGGG